MMRVIHEFYNCKKCGKLVQTKPDSIIAKKGLCWFCAYPKKEKVSSDTTIKNNYIISALLIYILSIGMLYNLIFGFEIEIIERVIVAMSTGALFGIGLTTLILGVPKVK